MSCKYPSQEYHPCHLHRQPPTWEDEQDCQWLDQATTHYRLAEHLQGQVVVYRQQVAWLEQEARREERQANQLVYQVGKGRAKAPEHHPPEHQHHQGHSQAEVVAAAVVAEEVAAAAHQAHQHQAHQPQAYHQADKQQRKQPQLWVRFQLPTEC